MTPLKLLDLFSGIGGFSLGLERSGAFETVAFCEINPFARRVLAKHWPGVPCFEDIRTLSASALSRAGIAVDAICGGFPCQDISFAGKGAGLGGERSGLWFEYARLIGELRPRFVIVENVGALLGRGLDAVLGTLASLGYDAEWHCIPASAVGAPHRRDRVWIVAHAAGERCGEARKFRLFQSQERASRSGALMADAHGEPRNACGARHADQGARGRDVGGGGLSENVADPDSAGLEGWPQHRRGSDQWASGSGVWPDAGHWRSEPNVGRVADGVPCRVDRLRTLGNAVVPQAGVRSRRARFEGRPFRRRQSENIMLCLQSGEGR